MKQNVVDLPTIDVPWCHREEPLPAVAAVAVDHHRSTMESFLQMSAASDFQTIRSQRCVVVFASQERLPWFDGIVYLGSPTEDPLLLVPTTMKPEYAARHVYVALRRSFGNGRMCVLPRESIVVDCSSVSWTVPSITTMTEDHGQ